MLLTSNSIINWNEKIDWNDRDYQIGDTLLFRVLDEFNGMKIGQETEPESFLITHIHSGFGMESDYVVLSLKKI